MIVERPRDAGHTSLGAVRTGGDVRFSLFSSNAEAVDLCLFDDDGPVETRRFSLERSGDVWATRVDDVPTGTAYGYRVHGPFAPEQGHRFNSDKLLLDPYARAFTGHPTWHASLYDHDRARRPAVRIHRRDTAPLMARSAIVDDAFDWQGVRPPGTSIEDTVVYEIHVKGFTVRHPEIPVGLRGTYLGLCHPAAVRHLVELGVTAVELLPVHFFVDDAFLLERGLRNYWGYNSIGFFAPDHRYAASSHPGAAVAEFKTMVRELHRAGIEVFLDVVYNHSGETDERGPTLCYRGIDNAAYYRLDPERPDRYVDVTGCGNTFQTGHPVVRDMILDSLRYWVETMGADGFRFDLAPALGRDPIDFNAHSELFELIKSDPIIGRAKLIAESWDLGAGGYQVGRFSAGWSEWNDQFRDTVRNFWIGSDPKLQAIGARVTGSSDLFRSSDRRPSASVNFVAAHDGFTLADAIAYPYKRNAPNGDRNRDGDPQRINGGRGQVGQTRERGVVEDRRRMTRSILAMLLMSQGVPMILGGDEIGRTQSGNNNAYCQDNELSWIDWSLSGEQRELRDYVAALIRLRRDEPLLRLGEFAEAEAVDRPRVRWFNEHGAEMACNQWQEPDRRLVAMTIEVHGNDHGVLVCVNAGDADAMFALPSSIEDRAGSVSRIVSSAVRQDVSDPFGLTPAGSLQLLRFASTASDD